MENSVMLSAVCNEPVSLKVVEEPFYRKGFSPFVNKETGTWWEYDDDKKGFFDTGIIAQGRDGETVDVRIDGKSIVQDGVAKIPVCGNSTFGVCIPGSYYGLTQSGGILRILSATESEIYDRSNPYKPISVQKIDYAVKSAMCDGKGEAWTSEEQAAARERMGIENGSDFELLVDATLEEEANSFVVKFPKPVRECLYHIWFFNNNGAKVIAQAKCIESDIRRYYLLKYTPNIIDGYGYLLNGYFRYNGSLKSAGIIGYAAESQTPTWTHDAPGNGNIAWMNYQTPLALQKVDGLSLELLDTSHVLNAGAVIRVWGR